MLSQKENEIDKFKFNGKNTSKNEIAKQISHIALIMDGNGRWANSRGLPRYKDG